MSLTYLFVLLHTTRTESSNWWHIASIFLDRTCTIVADVVWGTQRFQTMEWVLIKGSQTLHLMLFPLRRTLNAGNDCCIRRTRSSASQTRLSKGFGRINNDMIKSSPSINDILLTSRQHSYGIRDNVKSHTRNSPRVDRVLSATLQSHRVCWWFLRRLCWRISILWTVGVLKECNGSWT